MKAALPGAVVLLASGLWLAWPWLVPLVSPVPTSGPGSDLLVVLDGGSGRFAAADRIGQALSQPPHRLLIRCPRSTPPPQPTPELLQGFDTATKITALAHGDFQERCHSSAAVQAACTNGSCPVSLSSSGG